MQSLWKIILLARFLQTKSVKTVMQILKFYLGQIPSSPTTALKPQKFAIYFSAITVLEKLCRIASKALNKRPAFAWKTTLHQRLHAMHSRMSRLVFCAATKVAVCLPRTRFRMLFRQVTYAVRVVAEIFSTIVCTKASLQR
eukprot:PhF_6_TR17061/c0_g1_i1/m.26077